MDFLPTNILLFLFEFLLILLLHLPDSHSGRWYISIVINIPKRLSLFAFYCLFLTLRCGVNQKKNIRMGQNKNHLQCRKLTLIYIMNLHARAFCRFMEWYSLQKLSKKIPVQKSQIVKSNNVVFFRLQISKKKKWHVYKESRPNNCQIWFKSFLINSRIT